MKVALGEGLERPLSKVLAWPSPQARTSLSSSDSTNLYGRDRSNGMTSASAAGDGRYYVVNEGGGESATRRGQKARR